MANSADSWLDELGRRHPRLMLGLTICVAIFTTLIVIYNTKDTAIVYKAF
jgi:hypothetical protein